MSAGWSAAYVAMSALLGEPLDATLGALAPPGTDMTGGAGAAALPAPTASLASTLRSGSREVRAQALARALSEVVLAIESMRLA